MALIRVGYHLPPFHSVGIAATSGKNMAKALKEVTTNKAWDYEHDVYSHLLRKNKVLASSTEERSNYFNTLLQEFDAPYTRSGTKEEEMVQLMDGVYVIVKSQMQRLLEPKKDDTAEENWMEEEEDDDDSVIEDPKYKFFLENLRPDGKFYALEITQENVLVRYHHASTTEALTVCATENANHGSNEANVGLDTQNHANATYKGKCRGRKPKGSRKHDVRNSSGSGNCVSSEAQAGNYRGKRRGRKPKGSRKGAVKNSNGSGNRVASGAQKHADNNKGKRRGGRPKKKAVKTSCFDEAEGQTIDHVTKDDHTHTSSGIATKIKAEIEDYDDHDEAPHIIRPVQDQLNQEYWRELHKEANARRLTDTEYRKKLMQELKMPYCQEEYERLLKDITLRKPVQHHKELRGGTKMYEEGYLGKSLLDHHVDLKRKIDSVRDDHSRVLNLLRGFFYWLTNLSNEEAFTPWRDPSCLAVLPQ